MFQNDMTLHELGATCDTCLFWREAQCRVQAPTPTPMLASSPTARWPVTRAEDGCGRHPAVQLYMAGLTKAVGEALADDAPAAADTPQGPPLVPTPGPGPARGRGKGTSR